MPAAEPYLDTSALASILCSDVSECADIGAAMLATADLGMARAAEALGFAVVTFDRDAL